MRRIAIITPAILLFRLAVVFGQNPTANTSRIIGIVGDSMNSAGLAGAEVIVSDRPRPSLRTHWAVSSSRGSPPGCCGDRGLRAGRTPAQFRPIDDQCIVIVVWTQMQFRVG
jgi:hypothetical protein